MFSAHSYAPQPACAGEPQGLERLVHHVTHIVRHLVLVAFAAVAGAPRGAVAQDSASAVAPLVQRARSAPASDIDSLVAHAVAVNPELRAARSRVDAARARVLPAGIWPDPVIMAGIQNLPLGREEPAPAMHGAPTMSASGPDPMTMKMLGVGQTIPYPGKLGLRRLVAEREVEAVEAALATRTLQVVRDVRDAYYELAFIDRAMNIVERNRDLLVTLIKVTETRYSVGTAGQQDVLRARVEASRLAESAVALTEQRNAALARLNAVLDRPSEAPITQPAIPARIARAAVSDSARGVRFTSAALGARAADSPLPPVTELQETALRESPKLRESEATIAAQAARVELARTDYLPDFDVSLQYGQRDRLPDMVSAVVSIPIPLQKRRKQDAFVAEARSEVAALEAERAARRNELRAEVARLVSELERDRAQLALYVSAIIPQGRASLASATASYQVGRVEFITLLDNQATLFSYETEYFRVLTEFAKGLAELERIVGREILP